MSVKLVIGENIFEPDAWVTIVTDDVCASLQDYFGRWPQGARLYHNVVSQETDVTPHDEAGIIRLGRLQGTVFAIRYPGDPITIIVAVVAVAAAAAAAFLFSPQVPNAAAPNNQVQSSNNELSDRSNKPRPNGRIPDIFGTVRSIPDLIAVPYKTFENNIEIEHAFFCIGRGSYEVSDIKDDTTLMSNIGGTSLAVYAPFTSPNSGVPQLTIGNYESEGILSTKRYTSVNGQTVQGPNYKNYPSNGGFQFASPNVIYLDDSSPKPFGFDEIFAIGDEITLNDSGNLSGEYVIAELNENIIYLDSPELENPNWITAGSLSAERLASIIPTNPIQLGPFISDDPYATKAILNFVAPNGLYAIDENGDAFPRHLGLQYVINHINENGTLGPDETAEFAILGSSGDRTQRAKTLEINLSTPGPFQIIVYRLTSLAINEKGTWVEEVKWRDFYSAYPVLTSDFGNVTTAYAKTKATTGALSVKDRKLNMLATRLVPRRSDGALTASNSADDIIVAVSTDPRIGNRPSNQLNLDNIYNTVAEIKAYFGTNLAGEFNYTFDSSNMSYEETIASIAQTIFCTAYRRGNVINISFEKETDNSTLLFNHRNKVPGSETRSIRFGNQDDNDGVKLEYVDPTDEAKVTITLPTGSEPINPKTVETIGIRSYELAYLHAHRAWNKVRYQNTVVDFEALQEADLLVLKDRVLVADNTRADTRDGDVMAQDGLTLTLSQAYAVGAGDQIILQHFDGSTETIDLVGNGSNQYQVVLGSAPKQALSVGLENSVSSVFAIVSPSDDRSVLPFLITEKEPVEGTTNSNISAVNYDSRFYQNDKDFV